MFDRIEIGDEGGDITKELQEKYQLEANRKLDRQLQREIGGAGRNRTDA